MAELTEMSLASDRKGLAKFEQTAAYAALRQQLRDLESSSSQMRKRVDQREPRPPSTAAVELELLTPPSPSLSLIFLVNAEFNVEKEKARQLKAAADAAAPLTEETKALFETVRPLLSTLTAAVLFL